MADIFEVECSVCGGHFFMVTKNTQKPVQDIKCTRCISKGILDKKIVGRFEFRWGAGNSSRVRDLHLGWEGDPFEYIPRMEER